jgi:hypothetical protein
LPNPLEDACLGYSGSWHQVCFKGLADSWSGLIKRDVEGSRAGSFGYAFSYQLLMNLQFGLTLVIIHRVLDNLVEKVKNWKNMDKSMYSLLWFWIPAHTVTFMMPDSLRIGLAAVWSVALGLILGFYNRK